MYEIKFLPSAVKELKQLDFVIQKLIKRKIEILAGNPEILKNKIKHLKGEFEGKFRLRVRDYRIVFQKNDMELVIIIIHIGHRKNIYRM